MKVIEGACSLVWNERGRIGDLVLAGAQETIAERGIDQRDVLFCFFLNPVVSNKREGKSTRSSLKLIVTDMWRNER